MSKVSILAMLIIYFRKAVKIMFCPFTKENCKIECACFINGECALCSFPYLAEKLEGIEEANDTIVKQLREINESIQMID